GTDGSLVLLETKWGNVWQGVWDILKLASGHQHHRVSATYAVYSAAPREWAKYEERELFVPDRRASVTDYLLKEYEIRVASVAATDGPLLRLTRGIPLATEK